jgi:hypothetical protein
MVLHELKPEDREKALLEIRSKLRKDGIAILTVPHSKKDVAKELEDAAKEMFPSDVGVHKMPVWYRIRDGGKEIEKKRAQALFIGKPLLSEDSLDKLTEKTLVDIIDTSENWKKVRVALEVRIKTGAEPHLSDKELDEAIDVLQKGVRTGSQPKDIRPKVRFKLENRNFLIGKDVSIYKLGNFLGMKTDEIRERLRKELGISTERIRKDILRERGRMR